MELSFGSLLPLARFSAWFALAVAGYALFETMREEHDPEADRYLASYLYMGAFLVWVKIFVERAARGVR